METNVIWKKDLQFTGKNSDQIILPLDTGVQEGGEGNSFKPLELILIGLAGCTAMDVISILKKKRQEVTSFQIRVQAERAEEHPKIFTSILLNYELEGPDLDHEAVRRSVELSETKYCSAMAMLRKNCPIQTKIRVNKTILNP